MSEKHSRRGLFGLFAKGAVAAPFVGKAVIDAANAAPSLPVVEPEITTVDPRFGYVGGHPAFTVSCSMGPFTDMRFADNQDSDEGGSDWWDEPDDEEADA